MNLEKIKKLAERVKAGLREAEIGELIFMHHVVMQTIDMLRDENEVEAISICDALEQSIYNAISKKISNGEIGISNPSALEETILRYYEDSPRNSPIARELKDNLMDTFVSKGKRGNKRKIEKEKEDFVERYEKTFRVKKKRRVPSPEEIINSKTPKDIPNN